MKGWYSSSCSYCAVYQRDTGEVILHRKNSRRLYCKKQIADEKERELMKRKYSKAYHILLNFNKGERQRWCGKLPIFSLSSQIAVGPGSPGWPGWVKVMQHLETKFAPGMTWENYGPKGWHIDHICPPSRWFPHDHEDVGGRVLIYTNLQPLWAEDNLRKSNKEEYLDEEE